MSFLVNTIRPKEYERNPLGPVNVYAPAGIVTVRELLIA